MIGKSSPLSFAIRHEFGSMIRYGGCLQRPVSAVICQWNSSTPWTNKCGERAVAAPETANKTSELQAFPMLALQKCVTTCRLNEASESTHPLCFSSDENFSPLPPQRDR